MNQGEIWLVDLEPTIGAEMNKTRPALIVNNNKLGKLPLKVIVPTHFKYIENCDSCQVKTRKCQQKKVDYRKYHRAVNVYSVRHGR